MSEKNINSFQISLRDEESDNCDVPEEREQPDSIPIEHHKEIRSVKIDDKNQWQPLIVKVNGREYTFSKNAFYCLASNNKFRRFFIWLFTRQWFDYIILSMILGNSIVLALFDYKDRDSLTKYNQVLNFISSAFAMLFLIEAIIKIIAMGFVGHPHAYIRDPWNVMDFVIVITGTLEFVAQFTNLTSGVKLKSLRNLRVLRPLRSVNTIPGMRRLITALLTSLKELLNVAIFVFFLFLLFGILGLQLFQGTMYNQCRTTPEPDPITNEWEKVDHEFFHLCSRFSSGGFKCSANQTCGNPAQFDIKLRDDGVRTNSYIRYGMASYDNFFQSLLAVFQIITKDGWSSMLLNLMDVTYEALATVFVSSIVLLGSFFAMNLILAVIIQSFKEIQKQEDEINEEQMIEKETQFKKTEGLKFLMRLKKRIQEDLKKKEKEEKLEEKKGQNKKNIDLQNLSMPSGFTVVIDEEFEEQKYQQVVPNLTTSPLSPGKKFNHTYFESQSSDRFFLDTQDQDFVFAEFDEFDSNRDRETFQKIIKQDKQFQVKRQNRRQQQIRQRQEQLTIRGFHDFLNKNKESQKNSKKNSIKNFNREENDFTFRIRSKENSSRVTITQKDIDNMKRDSGRLDFQEWKKKLEAASRPNQIVIEEVIEDNQNQRPNPLVEALKKKFREALQIDDPVERQERNEAMKTENNFLMYKLKRAIRRKFGDVKRPDYGIKDEGNIVNMIQNTINNQRSDNPGDQALMAFEVHKQLKGKYDKKEEIGSMADKFRQVLDEQYSIEKLMEENELFLNQVFLEDRSEQFFFYRWCLITCQSSAFQILINICIIANTIVLAQDSYSNTVEKNAVLDLINLCFYAVFVLEMIIKLFGLGFKFYFQDRFNSFDFFIVLISSIDVGLTQSTIGKSTGSKAIQALRAFRLLRVFKLAKSWKQFQSLLKIIAKTLQDVSTFSILLFLFIFIYTLLGMEWFAYKVKYDSEGNLDLENGTFSDDNFNTFLQAFLMVFAVLTGDGWSDRYYRYYKLVNPIISSIFFVSLLVVGQYILLMLFIAILVENFDEQSISQTKEAHYEQKKQKKKFKCSQLKCYRRICKKIKEKDEENQEQQQQQQQEQNLNDSMQNEQQKTKLQRFVTHTKFDIFIVVLIAISSINLALDNPLLNPEGTMTKVIFYIDLALTAIFAIEVLLKVIAFGLLLNGPKSYLRSVWNILDLTIIVLSVILINQFFQIISIATSISDGKNDDLKMFKVLRMARVLRPLLVISKNERLRISMMALFIAIPNIINVFLIAMLLFLIFGIIGVNFLKGLFYRCETSNLGQLKGFDGSLLNTKFDCINWGGDWVKQDSNYDYIFSALTSIIHISQGFSWTTVMFNSTRIRGIDMVPAYYSSWYYSLFFILFIIIGNFFITNLFIGVLVSTYNREKEILGKNFLLTEQQREWLKTKLMVIQAKPKLFIKRPRQKWRKPFHWFVQSVKFDNFIIICIVLNTILLALSWYRMSELQERIIDYLNNVFNAIFVLEALFKILGSGLRYFKDSWNVFDFIIAFGSLVGVILANTLGVMGVSAATGLRSFRLAKLLKFFNKQKHLRIIFETFVSTLPALMNVGGLLLLLVYIFSILAMNLFASIRLHEPLTDNLNFQSIGYSSVTLFVLSTGDSVYEITNALSMHKNKIQSQCIQNPTYEDYIKNGKQTIGCGNDYIAIAFILSFIFIVTTIFLNLFIAIIIQGYDETIERSKKVFNSQVRDNFREIWSYFDQDATGFISIAYFPFFMQNLGQPLGWDESYKNDLDKQNQFIDNINLPTYNNCTQYSFEDIIENLVMLSVIQQELKQQSSQNDQNQGVEQLQDKQITENIRNTIQAKFKEAEQNKNVELVQNLRRQKSLDKRASLKDTDSPINNNRVKDILQMRATLTFDLNQIQEEDEPTFDEKDNEVLDELDSNYNSNKKLIENDILNPQYLNIQDEIKKKQLYNTPRKNTFSQEEEVKQPSDISNIQCDLPEFPVRFESRIRRKKN